MSGIAQPAAVQASGGIPPGAELRSQRLVRGLVRVAAAGVVAGTVISAPMPAHAQQCVPAGGTVTPVPWSQALLAPERAWPFATGAGQRVAVVSTGVASSPFLDGAVAARTDLAPADAGRPSGETDCLGVGTGVAGIIAASGSDQVGFQGLAPDARILDAKVVGDRFLSQPADSVTAEALAAGIDWAVDQDATVIVVPSPSFEESDALAAAVARALAADIVVVASVGDAGQRDELPGLEPYPAALDGVIGVAGLAPDGTATSSRTGQVDLVAPGVELITTYPGDGLGPASGTAYAAGYVAASAALLRAYRPDLSWEEAGHRLLATAAPAPEGVGSPRYGYGIVNPYQALVEEVANGAPLTPSPYLPEVPNDEELARQAAQERGDTLASRLVLASLLVAAAVVAAIGFGTRGRRRRWRPGVAPVPPERPEDDYPEPPLELFAETPQSRGAQK